MIAPNLATMLAFLATDVNIAGEPLQWALRESAAKSFNRMTIDTDSSTNDTVLILATGAAGNPEIANTTGDDYKAFCDALDLACIELAKKIARDGEGATKLGRSGPKRCKERSGRRDGSSCNRRVSACEDSRFWGGCKLGTYYDGGWEIGRGI